MFWFIFFQLVIFVRLYINSFVRLQVVQFFYLFVLHLLKKLPTFNFFFQRFLSGILSLYIFFLFASLFEIFSLSCKSFLMGFFHTLFKKLFFRNFFVFLLTAFDVKIWKYASYLLSHISWKNIIRTHRKQPPKIKSIYLN